MNEDQRRATFECMFIGLRARADAGDTMAAHALPRLRAAYARGEPVPDVSRAPQGPSAELTDPAERARLLDALAGEEVTI